METKQFEYDRFKSLSGRALDEYACPFADDRTFLLQESDLLKMMCELDCFDYVHLVYAIELGSRQLPEKYGPLLPKFLNHETQSVRIASIRNLSELPDYCITNKLLDSIKSALATCPEKEAFSDVLAELNKRYKKG